jgi:hypothetical protein
MFNLIKKENGNVLVQGIGQNYVLPQECIVRQTIEIIQDGRIIFGFDYSQLQFYKIEPDQTLYPKYNDIDLFISDVLAVDFFFPSSAGEAGEITGKLALIAESSTAVVSSPTATVVFPNITEVSVLRIQPTLNCIVQGIDSTGITKQQVWTLTNDSNFSITFPEENVNADPQNRFIMQGTQKGCGSQGSYFLMYDLVKNRFRFLVN